MLNNVEVKQEDKEKLKFSEYFHLSIFYI